MQRLILHSLLVAACFVVSAGGCKTAQPTPPSVPAPAAASGEAASGETAPGGAASGGAAPGGAVSGEAASGGAVPAKPMTLSMEKQLLEQEKQQLSGDYGGNLGRIQQINERLIQINILLRKGAE